MLLIMNVWIHMRMISSYPVLDDKSIMLLFGRFRKCFFKIRKSCISIWFHIDNRKDHFIRFSISKKLFINLRASADKCLFTIFCEKISLEVINRLKNRYSIMHKIPSCKDYIFTPRKDSPDGFKRLSSHDNRISGSSLSKMFKILRNMPGDFSMISDNAIASHSSDGDIFYLHE